MPFIILLIGLFGIQSVQMIEKLSYLSNRHQHLPLIAEIANRLVTAIVMDSRGVYASASKDEMELYIAPFLENATKLEQTLTQRHSEIFPEDLDDFTKISKPITEFIKVRRELVCLGRKAGGRRSARLWRERGPLEPASLKSRNYSNVE